jgi:hypothetical protein
MRVCPRVTEDTPCRFAVNDPFVEHGAPSAPLCRAYHIEKSKGPAGHPGAPALDARTIAAAIEDGECIRITGKDEDPS